MNITHLLNQTLAHRRPVLADDGAGGATQTMATIGTLAARLPQPTATERLHSDRAEAEHTQPVYVDPGADVRRGDELAHADGRTWRVTAVLHPSKPKYVRADCELLELRGQ
jgi:head-tail adaptor